MFGDGGSFRLNRDGQAPGSRKDSGIKLQSAWSNWSLGVWTLDLVWNLDLGVWSFGMSVNAKQFEPPAPQADLSRCESGHGCQLPALFLRQQLLQPIGKRVRDRRKGASCEFSGPEKDAPPALVGTADMELFRVASEHKCSVVAGGDPD